MQDPYDRQERFSRVVGRRPRPPAGLPPSREARAAMAAMARYRTRVPKGVFIYDGHEAANRDRHAWTVEAILARQPPA